jgi:hypothetical protein
MLGLRRLFGRRRGAEAPHEGAGSLADELNSQVRKLAFDLFTLEVNTILKDNMTGQRMPAPATALLDIAIEYVAAFTRLKVDLRPFFELVPPEDTRIPHDTDLARVPVELTPVGAIEERDFYISDTVVLARVFRYLRWAAKGTRDTLIRLGIEVDRADLFLLDRIENNADSLRLVLDRYHVLATTPLRTGALREGSLESAISLTRAQKDALAHTEIAARDLLVIRKIWEIGVEQIVAQTTIQVDGDVVTRITPDLARWGEHAKPVLSIHQSGIETGIASWRHLAATVESLVRLALQGARKP